METLVFLLLRLLALAFSFVFLAHKFAVVFLARKRPHPTTLAQLFAGIAVFAAFVVLLFLVLFVRPPEGAAGQPQPPATARSAEPAPERHKPWPPTQPTGSWSQGR